jgi:iron complex outermembrane receptor protein
LPPQKSFQWEGGAKAEFFDKRLSATLAFYDIDKTNIQR